MRAHTPPARRRRLPAAGLGPCSARLAAPVGAGLTGGEQPATRGAWREARHRCDDRLRADGGGGRQRQRHSPEGREAAARPPGSAGAPEVARGGRGAGRALSDLAAV